MTKRSKFQKGMKVKSILNKFTEYEIIEVNKNNLVVSPVGMSDIKHSCQKSIFEVIEK